MNKVLGSITAHLIRTGSGQELQKATISTNLHTFFAYLQNAVEEQCNVHERDEGLPKRERTCIEQENFESGEGLSSPVEHSSIQGSSPPESQASFQLPTGSGYSVRLDRIMPEPVTNIVILTFLKSITSSRKGKEGKLHWNPKPMQFRIANGHTNCIAINDGTFKPRVNNGAVWIDDPEALAYASLETKSRFDDWNDNVGGQSAKVKAQEAAEILGMMHQRISRLSSTQQLNRLSAFDRTYEVLAPLLST